VKHTKTQTTTHCLRCGRPLRAARSIANGYGRTCKAKVAAAKAEIVAQYKAHLVAKAEELIEQGGIVAIRARRIFQVVASDGTTTYKTHRAACTCKAGLKAKHTCYHRIAAHILSLAA
jgi:hypothetical protein